ncbi:MAG: GAF domain-containing protein [Anaerolineales bacterium]|nr:GAF domain-containing protein [Anaerolineales bacterium]
METANSSLKGEFFSKLTLILFPLLLVATIVVNVLAPIFAVNWAEQPFLGALFFPRLVFADTYELILASHRLGFQPVDVLSRIDDINVSGGRDVYTHLQQKQLEQRVTVQLERGPGGGAAEPLPLTLTPSFPLQNLLLFFWLPYGIGLIYLAMGFVLYRLRGADPLSKVFVAFCSFVSLFMGTLFDQFTLHFLTPVWGVALPLVGAGLLHLSFVFPVESRLARRKPWLPIVPYIVAGVMGVINLVVIYLGPDPRAFLGVWFWGFSFFALAVLLFLALLLNAHTTTFSTMVRQQIMIIFGGSVISFGPLAIWALAQVFGLELETGWFNFTVALACFIVFPIVSAYAALRYRLLDLDIVFSRATIYTLVALLVTLVYFLAVSALAVLLQDVELFENPIVFTMFILFLVIALGPVKDRLQQWVSRFLLRETADFRQLQQKYGRALVAAPLETYQILDLLLQQVDQALAPAHALVFLKDSTLDSYVIRNRHGGGDIQAVEVTFSPGDDLVSWLTDTNDILHLSATGVVSPDVKISREELARLNMLNVNLCVPLLGPNHLLGWLALSLKKSGQPYTSSDILFLATLASETTIALESAQLLEQANRRAAELEALQQISANVQAEAQSDLLLAAVVEQAARLLQAAGGLAFLLEPDEETLKVVVSYNLAKDYTGYTLTKGEGLAGQVVLQGQTLVVDNHQAFSGRSPKFQDARFGAVLGVPLRWGGKVRGVLHLIHKPRGPRFNERDIWLMELFAAQSSIALEKSRLLQEAQHRANQLATLSEVSVAISSTLDLDTALQRVMDCAVQILNAEAGSLLLMDPRGKELTFEVVLGPTGANLLGLKTEVGKGIVGTVAKTGQPLIINDATADPRWNVAFDEATNFRTKDILCVPMLSHERVVGVIEVINKQDGSVFTLEESGLLMSFGAQAAIAIENAQDFMRVDTALAERLQELQTLQAIDQELQSSLELKNVLDISLTRAMDALGVEMGLMGVIQNRGEEEPGLYLLAQRGMPTEMGRYKRDPWPFTKGIIGRVVRTGELAWVNDLSQDKDYVPNSHRTRSVLVVPVMREDKVIGVINMESTVPNYFTSDDVAFIKLLVGPAAIAIQNAQLFEQVKEANQAKTEFMNIASHELKIPMTSIKGFSKLLQMGAGGTLSDKQKEFVEVISNNVDRMARLVNDLLDVSRIEAGRIRLELENVQMRDVIMDVITSVQTQMDSKHLTLRLNVAENLPELRADYSRMVQIMTNFVSNAYKYTPEGGSISVVASPCTNGSLQGVTVTIKDTGHGISQEDQAKLFTKFFRSSDQNIRDEPGTGLGLSITKSMIEAHGGELTFESELGKGTSFTFTMPLVSKIPPGVEVIER